MILEEALFFSLILTLNFVTFFVALLRPFLKIYCQNSARLVKERRFKEPEVSKTGNGDKQEEVLRRKI